MSKTICLHVTLYSRPSWGLTKQQVDKVIGCIRTQTEVDTASVRYAAGRRGGLSVAFQTHQPLDRVDRGDLLSRVSEGCKLVRFSDQTAMDKHALAGTAR